MLHGAKIFLLRLCITTVCICGCFNSTAFAAEEGYCFSKPIQAGQEIEIIRQICGEPNKTYHWLEKSNKYDDSDPDLPLEQRVIINSQMDYNLWSYNDPEQQIIVYMIFEDGILRNIDQGIMGQKIIGLG